MERKVCFILDAGNWSGEWQSADAYPKADSPPLTVGGKGFHRQREGATCRNSTVSSDGHLEIGLQWSDQQHLDCIRYS